VLAYMGIYCIKSYVFYVRCNEAQKEGKIVEIKGKVKILYEEKKKALNGRVVTISNPLYTGFYNERELNYVSVVKRIESNIGDEVVLKYDEAKELLWAEGDLQLLKRQILIRFLVFFVLTVVLMISVFVL